jgi:hypothetical protein
MIQEVMLFKSKDMFKNAVDTMFLKI